MMIDDDDEELEMSAGLYRPARGRFSRVRSCGMDSRLAIVQKSMNGLTIVGRTSIGTWLQASDRC